MTEKELDSMATVQIKPEYAASEVYSTTSEPPPAYKRQTTSVQIAKIVAFTVIASSFIIGAFILASAYLQARASCDQMMALDSVLEKELMLETLQQEIPRAEALIGKEGNNDENDLQHLHQEEPVKTIEEPKVEKEVPVHENEAETDSSFSDNDETEDMQKTHMKVPLELDLSDIAATLLESNQKSRMNCVVERKHAEELVDSPAKTMQLPFGVNLTTDPKKAKFTGERISIFCESGSEEEKRKEDAEQIPPLFFPIQRLPIPFGPQPQQIPLTHMPQSMPPQPMIHQMPPPFQQIPLRPPVPPQVMQAPRAENPQIRIQVQRIPVREIHLSQEMNQIPVPIPSANEVPQIQIHRVPLNFALERAGITPEELESIERMAKNRFMALNHFMQEEASSAESSDSSAEDNESESQSHEHVVNMQHPPQPQQTLNPPMPKQQLVIGNGPFGRIPFGRNLPNPVQLPTPMNQPMQPQESSEDTAEPESTSSQHYIHPRSIREAPFKASEKRVRRCACDCNC